MDWRKLTDNDISSYIHLELIMRRGLKEESIDRQTSTYTGFYKFAWENGMLSKPKKFKFNYKLGKEEKRKKTKWKVNFNLKNQYLDRVLFDQTLSGVSGQSDFIRERNELTLQFGFHGGLRTSEVTDKRNLDTAELKDLISKAGAAGSKTIVVKIFGKGNKFRMVDLPPVLTNKIKYFIDRRRNNIPDGPLICSAHGKELRSSYATDTFTSASRSMQHKISRMLRELPEDTAAHHYVSAEIYKTLTFHCLRHTYATNLVDFCYRHGFDPWLYVPEQMGHTKEATTREYIVFDALIHHRENVRKALEND